jgi:xanthine phosphoribosyltransferase
MLELRRRIREQGATAPGGVIRVDSFLNHQIDPLLADRIADEFVRRFSDVRVTRVLTIEASGIAFAVLVALKIGVPLVFAKKGHSRSLGDDAVYTASVRSFTRGDESTISVARRYLTENDSVLIIDDFLAMGEAAQGLVDIVRQSGANVGGVGIVIEKGFQPGGRKLREQGVRVESLAVVSHITDQGEIVFQDNSTID